MELIRYRAGSALVDHLDLDGLLRRILEAATQRNSLKVTYLNAHGFRLVHRDNHFANLLQKFDVVFCDGVGVRIAFRVVGAPLPARMTPPDFVEDLAKGVRENGQHLFLLGDEQEVVAQMASKLNEQFDGVVRGFHHGFFEADAQSRLIQSIRDSGASLILVGMGQPRQEKWIVAAGESLPGTVLMGVGGLFRWYSGKEWRGPRWMTDHGLEWLSRLLVQRHKVAERYLVGLPAFGLRVLKLRILGPRLQTERREGADHAEA